MNLKKSFYVLGICALVVVISYTVYTRNQQITSRTEFSSETPSASYRGPLDDCLQNAFLYSQDGKIAADCAVNYVHFYPNHIDPREAEKTRGKLRIGSFNVFHLGDNQAPLKNMKLVASIMNQWDLVGTQELMPLSSEWATTNSKIHDLLAKSGKIAGPYDNWSVMLPGYLRLLSELRRLDPAWALILQAEPQGEASSTEMAGFYYRSNKVNLKDWDYCKADLSVDLKTSRNLPNYACFVRVPKERRELMSRLPFVAYFQSGTFDFVAVTTHVRFRPEDEASALSQQEKELCQLHATPDRCKIPKETVGRYYEVEATAAEFEAMQKVARDHDVIFMGDFNLAYDKKSQDLWNAALKSVPGYIVTQTDPTTLSIPAQRLASNYDHFIFDPKKTRECSVESVRIFDFTQALQDSRPVMKEIAQYLGPDGKKMILEDTREYYSKLTKFQPANGGALRPLNEKEKESMAKSYADSIGRMEKNMHGALLELISDHIPIEMECTIGNSDDD